MLYWEWNSNLLIAFWLLYLYYFLCFFSLLKFIYNLSFISRKTILYPNWIVSVILRSKWISSVLSRILLFHNVWLVSSGLLIVIFSIFISLLRLLWINSHLLIPRIMAILNFRGIIFVHERLIMLLLCIVLCCFLPIV